MATVDDLYFQWLKRRVHTTGKFTDLLSTLHSAKFRPILGNDSDRFEDGLELRDIFLREAHLTDDVEMDKAAPCTFLEMLIGISERMENMMYTPRRGDKAYLFFWEILDNLGLSICTDERLEKDLYSEEYILSIIDDVNTRNYSPDGSGGMFPLRNDVPDQRKIEIWDQMCSYLNERYLSMNFL